MLRGRKARQPKTNSFKYAKTPALGLLALVRVQKIFLESKYEGGSMSIKKTVLTTIIFSLCVLPSFGQKGKGIRAAVGAMKNTPTHVTNPVKQALNNISRRSSAVRINGAPALLQNDVQRTVAVNQLNAQININLTRQAVINMGRIGHSEDEALKEGMWTITGTAEE